MSPLRGISVLLIEDNPDIRDMTVLMLEGLGATVRVAEDGAEGFAKVVKIAPERAHATCRSHISPG